MLRDTQDLRRAIPVEEFDYQALMQALKDYAYPRDKVTELIKRGDIIRVKKGIYVFGEKYALRPFSREILANLIYGPSYVSLDYALHYYGIIPERVETLTSVISGRGKRFVTPVGLFTYETIPVWAYPSGVTRVELADGLSFLMAWPEKAIADKIYTARGGEVRSVAALRAYLTGSLRMDHEAIISLDLKRLDDIAQAYQSRKVSMLNQLISASPQKDDHHE